MREKTFKNPRGAGRDPLPADVGRVSFWVMLDRADVSAFDAKELRAIIQRFVSESAINIGRKP